MDERVAHSVWRKIWDGEESKPICLWIEESIQRAVNEEDLSERQVCLQ